MAPSQLPASLRDSAHQLFFSDLMEAHEVAHQWWGNVVISSAYQDEWMLEALSSYSALLWLEKKKGPKAVEGVLDGYRDHLAQKDPQGHIIESAGPIVWGTRLDSTGVFDAWRTITYEKGAWIFHMLRRRLGDDRFLKMLAELRRRYEFRAVSTDDLRVLAKEFVPPKTPAGAIDTFFENWVYSTGVPSLKLTYKVTGAAPAFKVTGTLTQTGVDDDFTIEAPLEIQFAKGTPQTIWVRTSGEPTPFSVTLKQAPQKVVVADGVLARK
jgi:aminopeptidase N